MPWGFRGVEWSAPEGIWIRQNAIRVRPSNSPLGNVVLNTVRPDASSRATYSRFWPSRKALSSKEAAGGHRGAGALPRIGWRDRWLRRRKAVATLAVDVADSSSGGVGWGWRASRTGVHRAALRLPGPRGWPVGLRRLPEGPHAGPRGGRSGAERRGSRRSRTGRRAAGGRARRGQRQSSCRPVGRAARRSGPRRPDRLLGICRAARWQRRSGQLAAAEPAGAGGAHLPPSGNPMLGNLLAACAAEASGDRAGAMGAFGHVQAECKLRANPLAAELAANALQRLR